MGFWGTVGRVAAGVGTMGGSEVYRAGSKLLGGGGVGDNLFGGVRKAGPGDQNLYEYGGSPERAQEMRDYLRQRAEGAAGRAAPQLDRSAVDNAMRRFGGAYAGNAAAFRDEGQSREEQMRALGMYRDAAEGRGESVAAAQMRQGLEESSRMGQNLAAGAVGANPLLAYSNAAAASADAARRSTSTAAALRAQEIAEARAGYAGLSGQMRQGDLSRAGAMLDRGNAALGAGQFGFGAEQAQAGLEMQNRGMNDANEQAYMQNLLQMERDALGGRVGYGNALLGASQTNAQTSLGRRGQNQQVVTDIAKGVAGAAIGGGLG